MGGEHWSDFRRDIRRTLDLYVGPVVTDADGLGEYDGRTEDTAVLVGEQTASGVQLGALRIALQALARRYGQEAIALAVAEVDFVEPLDECIGDVLR
jgi:hypothetical protein